LLAEAGVELALILEILNRVVAVVLADIDALYLVNRPVAGLLLKTL